jgi:isopropylmalate/homocitrate/citramalate synthase
MATKTPTDEALDAKPWHQPGRWLANPAYWDAEAKAQRARMPRQVRFIDCTVSEGDDCVGHQLNWNTRLGLIERLDAVGVGEITLPSHATFREEADLVRACRRIGIRTRLVAKGPGVVPPLAGDWRGAIDRHIDLGADAISPIVKWSYDDTTSDFGRKLTKQMVVDAIAESIAYMKRQRVRIVPWIVDSLRTPVDTVCLFAAAMARAGADGVYLVDSRGNSTPLATRVFVSRVKAAVGDCDVYIQHHNDLGVATANAVAAAEGGATWIDASVIGIGVRGGCVALEEAATLLEMYGVDTGIKLDSLYELCCYVRDAFGVSLPPWKPIVGENWTKEEGMGHLEGSSDAEATIGIAPRVVGREFESVIGAKLLFGRERSSAHTDEPVFVRELLHRWNMTFDGDELETILFRARAAVATNHGRHYLTFDEFRAICDGVLAKTESRRP